ncbi:MAG TPA: glycosyltransferase family 39 protein, partial [Roseiflexaceae bacterium]|nr:glycosyltransferase family 39 protein [Roseiflexaceae bacterium]
MNAPSRPGSQLLPPIVAVLVLLLLALWNLGGPAAWWDEGWTLSVARNLVERGHYGRLLAGEPAPGGLEASPVVTLPVALAFELFGVGLWQGRFFGALCTVGMLALSWWLAAQLFNRRIAWGTLAVLLLLSAHPQLNA